MGLERVGEEQGLVRYRASGEIGNVIDIQATDVARGHGGPGTVHHIAWRAKDVEDQEERQHHVANHGFGRCQSSTVNILQRYTYGKSGEILFEIATDPPGFTRDESFETLGEKLMLPAWYESNREHIERGLPPLQIRVLEEDI